VCREVIVLHYRYGHTFREIAERLNVSETTVYKHLRSALDQLRLTLTPPER
jgi:RNA polymerase sigma-70 factor (ECF subfamily)